MGKAFLSHSSQDKILVEAVAKKLGKNKCVYDTFTFEAGMKTLNEIYKTLEETDLFVLFISNSSLDSKWVQLEIFEAYKKLVEDGKIKRIYPVIIDRTITYSDPRIPEWLKKEYNLKMIPSARKIALTITRLLTEILWEEYPYLKDKVNFFSGRNDLVEKLEMSYQDFEEDTLCFVASGVDKIGRKSLLKYSLKKLKLLEESQDPVILKIDSEESIEDFILKLYETGLIVQDFNMDFRNVEMVEKIKILTLIIKEIQSLNEIIIIEDNGGIILPSGDVVKWFSSALKNLKERFVFAISSKFPLKIAYKHKKIATVKVPPLSKSDRIKMFASLLEQEKLNELPRSDKKWISDLFAGYPEQIKYTIELLKEFGITSFSDKALEIVQYNTDKVLDIFNGFNDEEKDILILLSHLGIVTRDFLYNLLETKDGIDKCEMRGICEYSGNYKEYISLSDNMKDFLYRSNYKIKNEYEVKLKKFSEDFLEDVDKDKDNYDYTVINFTLKQNLLDKLKKGENFSYFLPSHYLKTITNLYKREQRYKEVVFLAREILKDENNLDPNLVHEIRKYLCLALARDRNPELKNEVQKIKGPEHFFIFGFYFRLLGKSKKAVEYYSKVLELQPNFTGAQRELVIVLSDLGSYESAFDLAKHLYENSNKSNPYIVQSYLRCLLRARKDKNISKIKELLGVLKDINTELSNEMFERGNAEYLAYIENDPKAIMAINKIVEFYRNNHYLYVEKFDICEKFNDINGMSESLKALIKLEKQGKTFLKNIISACSIVLDKKQGKETSIKILSLKNSLPEPAYEKLNQRLENIH